MSGVAANRTPLPDPHDFEYGPVPGVCRWCPLPKGNRVHDPAKVGQWLADAERWKSAEARRLGETKEE